jgi:hypothetical protein
MSEKEKIKREIEDLDSRIHALRLAFNDGAISFDEYLSETTRLYNRLVELKRKLSEQ